MVAFGSGMIMVRGSYGFINNKYNSTLRADVRRLLQTPETFAPQVHDTFMGTTRSYTRDTLPVEMQFIGGNLLGGSAKLLLPRMGSPPGRTDETTPDNEP
jgi:hypothetical protein